MCPHNTGKSRSAPPTPPPAAAVSPPPNAPALQPILFASSRTVPVVNKPSRWSTSLCSCYEDFSTCFTTCCCPCITFGRNSEIISRGNTSCVGAGLVCCILACCSCLYTCTYRKKLRSRYGLLEEPCADVFVHCCCQCCALCQEYRELHNYGFDPSVGWLANADRFNRGRGTVVPPTIASSMTR